MTTKTVIGLAALALTSGCATSDSARTLPYTVGESGIPYNLPRTLIEVQANLTPTQDTKGRKIDWTVESRFVPDEYAVHYLDPQESGWVASDIDVTLKDGLLSSVSTVDDNRSGEVINNAIRAAINIAKSAAFLAASGDEKSPFLTAATTPTEREINALLSGVRGRTHTLILDPRSPPARGSIQSLPGTNAALYMTTSAVPTGPGIQYIPKPLRPADADTICNQYRGAVTTKAPLATLSPVPQPPPASIVHRPTPPYNPPAATMRPAVQSCVPYASRSQGGSRHGGVCTRTLKPHQQGASLWISSQILRARRASEMEREIARLARSLREASERSLRVRNAPAMNCNKADLAQRSRQLSMQLILAEERKATADTALTKELRARLNQLETRQAACRAQAQQAVDANFNVLGACRELDNLIETATRNWLWRPSGDYLLSQTDAVIMVTDDTRGIRVPLERASAGNTTNTLVFDRGVLVDYQQTRPAAFESITAGLVTATQSLYDGIVAIARIPIQALGIQTEESAAVTALAEARILETQRRAELEALDGPLAQLEDELQLVLTEARLEAARADPLAYLELDGASGDESGEDDSSVGGEELTDSTGDETSDSLEVLVQQQLERAAELVADAIALQALVEGL